MHDIDMYPIAHLKEREVAIKRWWAISIYLLHRTYWTSQIYCMSRKFILDKPCNLLIVINFENVIYIVIHKELKILWSEYWTPI